MTLENTLSIFCNQKEALTFCIAGRYLYLCTTCLAGYLTGVMAFILLPHLNDLSKKLNKPWYYLSTIIPGFSLFILRDFIFKSISVSLLYHKWFNFVIMIIAGMGFSSLVFRLVVGDNEKSEKKLRILKLYFLIPVFIIMIGFINLVNHKLIQYVVYDILNNLGATGIITYIAVIFTVITEMGARYFKRKDQKLS